MKKENGKNKSIWNLSLLVKNESEFENQRKIIEKENYKFINKWKDRNDYLKNPEILKQALDEYENLVRFYSGGGVEEYYFWLRSEKDKNNPKIKASLNKVSDFANKIGNDIQFFEMRISRIEQKNQKKFLEAKELKEYKHFLEKLFAMANHLLSEEAEKVMNLKAATSHSNWVKMTSGFLAKEEREVLIDNKRKEKKNFSEIISLLDNANKKVRDSAAIAFNEILDKHSDAAEAELNSILQNKKNDDELRKFSRPDKLRHIDDDIESEVVDAMVKAVSNRFDISAKFYQLKAKLLKLKKLQYHERNVSYGKVDKNYSFDQAIKLVDKTFKNLDEEFSQIFQRFLNNGQIDIYPAKGKANGAFCASTLISLPTYILLNHNDKLRDVLTLAHELGHGINNELSRKQNALYYGHSLATAEVASTFFEDFVLETIRNDVDDKTKLSLMIMKLGDNISTIFRQVACYRFETELHNEFRKKGYLSKEEIGKIFQKHMKSYMGSAVEQSEGAQNWWIYWGHIRRFFYNYSYANGLLISSSLQASFRKNPEFIKKIKEEFLAAGVSQSPKNIFGKMGIDITDQKFWNQGLDEIEGLLNEATKLAKKLKEI